MKGTYCVLASLSQEEEIVVGSLGRIQFPAGLYAYVGSAQRGIQNRVGRHRSKEKKRRWHVDYFLGKAEVLSVIALPGTSKEAECAAAQSLLECEGARVVREGFGSSDCSCSSHLILFGDSDPEWVAEAVSMRLAMLKCVYPSKSI
ncbi:MAG TPA: GIY-YIG nuclease family protein [Thermoplasmata archaeon]|jgi:Uri superfamily endonuclease